MTWEYRPVRAKQPDGSEVYGIHEFTLDDAGHLLGFSEEACSPYGESLEELKLELGAMLRCLSLGVEDWDELQKQVVEVIEPEEG